MINFTETISGYICESCGDFSDKAGKTEGWIKTMCESCAKKEKRKWRKIQI